MGILMWLRVQWDRALAVVAVGLGLLALLLGWIGTSDALYVAQQMPYLISGGLLGIFLLILGSVLWLSSDLRDEWRELRELKELHAAHFAQSAPEAREVVLPDAAREVLDTDAPRRSRRARLALAEATERG